MVLYIVIVCTWFQVLLTLIILSNIKPLFAHSEVVSILQTLTILLSNNHLFAHSEVCTQLNDSKYCDVIVDGSV